MKHTLAVRKKSTVKLMENILNERTIIEQMDFILQVTQ